MAITPTAGYKVDPTNPNAVVRDDGATPTPTTTSSTPAPQMIVSAKEAQGQYNSAVNNMNKAQANSTPSAYQPAPVDQNLYVKPNEDYNAYNQRVTAYQAQKNNPTGGTPDTKQTPLPAGWDQVTYNNFKAANPTLEPTAEDTQMMLNAVGRSPLDSGVSSAYNATIDAYTQQMNTAQSTIESAKARARNDPALTAALDQISNKYNVLIEDAKQKNRQILGSANNAMSAFGGLSPMSPLFLGSEVTAADKRVAAYQAEEDNLKLQTKIAYDSQNAKAVTDLQTQYDQINLNKTKAIGDLAAAVNKQVQDNRDYQMSLEKMRYDQVTKPVQDIASKAAENGLADPKLLDAISKSGSVSDALNLAGDYIQTATGDVGAYLFVKRQAMSSGGSVPNYETWQAALDQKKLDSEIAKYRVEKGIDFSYSLELERAKQKMASAPTPNYKGEFAATIKLAAQAGTTNVQRAQIKGDLESFISEGDYKSAYAQVVNSAGNKLSGTNATTFQDQLTSLSTLQEMKSALQEYAKAGGNTNIFKGGADAIQTKIGVLATDPEYAQIAVRLNTAFQGYRQSMTGAAFSPAETKEYASVLPSSGNTFALNMAKINGAEAYLNGVVEGTLKNTVGEGGIYIKQYAEAGKTADGLQQAKVNRIKNWNAANPGKEPMIEELQAAGLSEDQIMEKLHI